MREEEHGQRELRRHLRRRVVYAASATLLGLGLSYHFLAGPAFPRSHDPVPWSEYRVEGMVLTAGGEPIAGARVHTFEFVEIDALLPNRNGTGPDRVPGKLQVQPATRSRDDGSFVLCVPREGSFTVIAEPENLRDTNAVDVAVRGKVPVTDVELRAGPPLHWIDGTIRNEIGDPMPHCSVTAEAWGDLAKRGLVVPMDFEAFLSSSAPPFAAREVHVTRQGRTDDHGRFRLPLLDDGPHALAIRCNCTQIAGPLIDAASSPVEIILTDEELAGCRIEARVIDGRTGAPIEDARVQVSRSWRNGNARHEVSLGCQWQDGAYRAGYTKFMRLGLDYEYWLRIEPAESPESAALAPAVSPRFRGENLVRRTIALQPWAALPVLVVDKKGNPVPHAWIHPADPSERCDSDWLEKAQADGEGRLTLRLPPMRLQLVGSRRAWPGSNEGAEVELRPGDNAELRLTATE